MENRAKESKQVVLDFVKNEMAKRIRDKEKLESLVREYEEGEINTKELYVRMVELMNGELDDK